MTTIFDPGFGELVKDDSEQTISQSELEAYDQAIETIMTRENMTLIQLFKTIAIK